jgi:RNA recognition motif-containing protein
MASKVFVGNLDFNTTRVEVQTLFAEVGAIRDVYLPMDRTTGRPRGFAFVEFESDEDAAKAIEKFNNFQLGGRALRVNAAEDRPRTGGPGGFGARRPPMFSGGGPPPEFDFGGGGDRDNYGGGRFGGGGAPGGGKSKGSRRNIRAKKRSL